LKYTGGLPEAGLRAFAEIEQQTLSLRFDQETGGPFAAQA